MRCYHDDETALCHLLQALYKEEDNALCEGEREREKERKREGWREGEIERERKKERGMEGGREGGYNVTMP